MRLMGRTTLHIEDDALKMAKCHASRRGLTLGQAVSELVRRGADRPLILEEREGLYIPKLTGRSAKITSELVNRLREELP